jgi:hypothetical protein
MGREAWGMADEPAGETFSLQTGPVVPIVRFLANFGNESALGAVSTCGMENDGPNVAVLGKSLKTSMP